MNLKKLIFTNNDCYKPDTATLRVRLLTLSRRRKQRGTVQIRRPLVLLTSLPRYGRLYKPYREANRVWI